MFKKLFGGSEKGGAGTSKPPPPVTTVKSATATVDAIQRLGEVQLTGRAVAERSSPFTAACMAPALLHSSTLALLPTAAVEPSLNARAASPSAAQTEELLTKRRNLLEKKIAHELERAKELTKQGNKRGEVQPDSGLASGGHAVSAWPVFRGSCMF